MSTAPQFQAELSNMLAEAQQQNLPYIDIEAGTLHRRVGNYPDPQNHRMPICCNMMRQNMRDGDRITNAPPKGNGATLGDCAKITSEFLECK